MKKFFILAAMSLLLITAKANNLTISSLSLTGQNTTEHTTKVQFTISWENSWRTSSAPTNWDAAWVFIKYKDPTTLTWKHATISTVAADHTAPAGCVIKPAPEGTGAMLFRSADGNGTVEYTNVQLEWAHGTNGMTDANAGVAEVTVQAIEMVYVVEAPFFIGDGNGGTQSSTGSYFGGTNDALRSPVQITTALSGPINAAYYTSGGTYNNSLHISGLGGIDWNNDNVIDNANFPCGYKAFYCMKYEVSQAQYAVFLRLLSGGQSSARYDATKYGTNGYSITNTFTAEVPDRVCNFMSFDDLLAYCDWAAIRPMTSLEYEKAARGPDYPGLYDMAFGPQSLTVPSTEATNVGMPNEVSSVPANANARMRNSSDGSLVAVPYRVGSFATSASSRVAAGASYYGILNLSDNVSEACIFTYQQAWTDASYHQFRNFDGSNGDGMVDASGRSDVPLWPNDPQTLSMAFKGAGLAYVFSGNEPSLTISANDSFTFNGTNRAFYNGGRGVRSDW